MRLAWLLGPQGTLVCTHTQLFTYFENYAERTLFASCFLPLEKFFSPSVLCRFYFSFCNARTLNKTPGETKLDLGPATLLTHGLNGLSIHRKLLPDLKHLWANRQICQQRCTANRRIGWCQDKYGISWQFVLTE